jgi:integrase
MTTCARFGRSVTRPSDARNVSTAASWCINRRADGGLELPAKVVQARLGHASIVMTLDTYGHLFPRGDDGAELAAAERALLG